MRNEFEDRLSSSHDEQPAAAEQPATVTTPTPTHALAVGPAAGPAIVDEVLIEEVSIDGMCGVY